MRPADNPFATHRLDQLPYRFPGGERERADFYSVLEASGYFGALVGPRGHGKSTLLREIERHCREQGFPVRRFQLRESEPPPSFPAPTAEEILLLDGAEQFSLRQWWHFRWRMRFARGLVITTHRPGRLPTLHYCRTSSRLLRELIENLSPGSHGTHFLFEKHRGNLREALFECYDLLGTRPARERLLAFSPEAGTRAAN